MSQGTVQLQTERLILRRHRPEDAAVLYQNFGADPEMTKYSGWNPYATAEMAREAVSRFIDSYQDTRFYGWAVEYDGRMIGVMGAYDFDPEEMSVEVGCSIERKSWGKGFASEAIRAVIAYLTENEGIRCIKAWCAADNIGSAKIMERAGMTCTGISPGALEIDGQTYDQMFFELKV